MKKRIFSILLAMGMMLALLPMAAFADTGAFTVTGGAEGSDYSYANNTLTILTDTALTIANADPNTATATDKIVVPAGVTAKITLAGVNIASGNGVGAPLAVAATATANITLAEDTTNTLTAYYNNGYAGLEVPNGATVVINGAGTLNVTGGCAAGIGGSEGTKTDCGTITIKGNAAVTAKAAIG